MKNKTFKEKVYAILIVVSIIVLAAISILKYDDILAWIDKLSNILFPFVFGAIIAYLLNPLYKNIDKYIHNIDKNNKLKEKTISAIAIAITEILFMVIISAVIMLIIPQVVTSIRDILASMPDAMASLEKTINNLVSEHTWIKNIVGNNFSDLQYNLVNYIGKIVKENVDSVITNIASSISSIAKTALNIMVGIMVSILLLANKKNFAFSAKKAMYAIMDIKISNAIIDELKVADKMFSGFFVGKLIDSVIIGIITFICMTMLNIPYTILISVIVGITNIIPFFGPFIGAIPGAIIILSKDPLKSLIFIVLIVIIQQFDGNILGPKLIGNSTGLNTFWVMFSILVFGGLWGVVGMLIGVPLMAVIQDIASKIISMLLHRKNIDEINLEKLEEKDKNIDN